jgi:hypothetical protein
MPWPNGSLPRLSFQPDASRTFSMHSTTPFDVMRKSLMVVVYAGSAFLMRISAGSMPTFSAHSSNNNSNAKRVFTAP